MATWTETVSGLLGIQDPGPLLQFLIAFVGAGLWATIILTIVGFSLVWLKRKWNARLGDRIAINRVGPFGLLIMFADAAKLLSKEVVVPNDVDRVSYIAAPILVVVGILTAFVVIPWGSGLQLADPEAGLVLAFAFASLSAIAIVMAGYGSNNKYSFLGFEREVAQTIAYEIPLVLGAAAIVPLVPLFVDGGDPLRLSHIVQAQQGPLYGIEGVPLPNWFLFAQPVAGALVFVALLAEFGRNPFDLPEAGSELVAGYMTEYGGVNFVLMFFGEFAHIWFGAALFTALFLGGGAGPLLPGVLWFIIKMFAFWFVVQWMRAAIPRVRIDQLLEIGWKRLLELTFLNLLVTTGIMWTVI